MQDTIRAPNEAKILKKASWVSMLVTSAFYLAIGTIGYAAFGDDCPGNLLTGTSGLHFSMQLHCILASGANDPPPHTLSGLTCSFLIQVSGSTNHTGW